MSELNSESINSGSGVAEHFQVELPPEKDVVFYNDDFTTMEFVVEVLISVFNKTPEIAEQLMQAVHENGSAIVGTYTFDIAVSRANLTKNIAKKNGFPLRVEVE